MEITGPPPSQKPAGYQIPSDYCIVFCICVLLMVFALTLDTPAQIISSYYKINTSRSVLVTDYIALAGISATLVNSAISGFFYLFLLILNKRDSDGQIVSALFVTMGFSLFGKNMFNTLPILAGVWLYSKVCRVKFSDLFVKAMFSATIAPLVSEIAFLDDRGGAVKIIAAYGVGLFVGFIFPVVTEAARRMHRGYCLYNSGTAGGLISTFFVGLLRSVGIDILPVSFWDTSHTLPLAFFAYAIAVALIIYGAIVNESGNVFKKFMSLMEETDVRDHDYLTRYGGACYINIGVMCILATSVILYLNVPVNGPVLGGIFTVAGFAADGKHLKNTVPLLLGSVIAAQLNHLELAAPGNALAILFSTGLAPVCGKHGWRWGIAVGFLHVSVALFIGNLNGGLNLYNNGFAGGFVAITIVPLIVFFKELIRAGGEEN